MTFKKNALAVILSTLFILLCAYLTHMSRDVLVYGLFVWIAGSTMSLALEDMIRKWTSEKEKLTWQYFTGIGLIFLATLTFLWTVETQEMKFFIARFGVAVFLATVGAIWFYIPYKTSIMDDEEIEKERWKNLKKRIKGYKIERQMAILLKNLRYHVIGDSFSGDLDLDKPLNFYKDECLTANEIKRFKDDEAQILYDDALKYIKNLLEVK